MNHSRSSDPALTITEKVMRKIISLFQRNYDGDRLVRNEVVPGAEWVLAGEGKATRKWDGTCCLYRTGELFKRYEVKPGGTPPAGFSPANEVDENTGKQQGWLFVSDLPENRWHLEGLANLMERYNGKPPEGTYELIGPKVQGNPEGFSKHVLIPHGSQAGTDLVDGDGGLVGVVLTFDGIRDYLATHDMEGIVWHHPDGRMVKIKGKDFGLKRERVS